VVGQSGRRPNGSRGAVWKAPLKDIVERLRKSGTSLALEAADEIEKGRHALRLIANGQVTVTPCEPQEDDDGMAWPGHYGRA
jgi:hypothetical protein